MTRWVTFCRILCHSRRGYQGDMPYELAVRHVTLSAAARALHMIPPPDGDAMVLSDLAKKFIAEEGAA